MEVIFIIGIILLIIGLIFAFKDDSGFAWVFGVAGGYVISVPIFLYFGDDDKPSAMDVYQGKTVLKYTYIDSVAVDSCVVFKPINE